MNFKWSQKMWIVEGGMDDDEDTDEDTEDDDDDNADEDNDEDDNINNEDNHKIIEENIHDYKPWFKYDVAPRFICDLIGYFCLFTKLLLSLSQCNLQLGTLLHSCTFSPPLSTNLVTLANLDCCTLSTNVVLVDSIIKWPMTQSHIEYGMQKTYDEDEIEDEKPKINKTTMNKANKNPNRP